MINVLIIEDDPMVRDINSKFLNKLEQFNLMASLGNIDEAKKFLEKNIPHLILLDLYLPKQSGITFLKWIRENNIEVDIILITADKSIASVKEAFRYGAVDYLIKPFTFERFKESLMQFKNRCFRLNDYDMVEQKIIDRYIVNNEKVSRPVKNEDGLVKGLSKHTYQKIMNTIIGWKELYFTADEIAEALGMARVTVRRYLEYMEKRNKIEVIMEYGKVGRPQHKYKLINS